MAVPVAKKSCSRVVSIRKSNTADGADLNGHFSKVKTKTREQCSRVFDPSMTVRLYIFSLVVILVIGFNFLCKHWMGFSSMSFGMGIFVYIGSAILWKITTFLGQMMILIKRTPCLERCSKKDQAAVLENNDGGRVLQNRNAEAVNIDSELSYVEGYRITSKGVDHDQCYEEPNGCDRENNTDQKCTEQVPDEACAAIDDIFDGKRRLNRSVNRNSVTDQVLVRGICSNIPAVEDKPLDLTDLVDCAGTDIEGADVWSESITGSEIVATKYRAVVEDTAATESIAADDRGEFELKVKDQCALIDEECKRSIELDGNHHTNTEKLISYHHNDKHDAIKDLRNDLLMIIAPDVSMAIETASKYSGSLWRNSSGRESEIDYYCSSSVLSTGRRNHNISNNLYETYKERMQHLDMINYQYMYAVGPFPLKQGLKKSKSQKIASLLRQAILKKRELEDDDDDHRCKYDLETVYVAQTCLTWEVLHWQYKKVQQLAASANQMELSLSYDHVAEQFQQFQVLLQRFLENEPFDQGPRIQVYARNRCLLPKLLQVPAVKASVQEEQTATADQTSTPVTASQLINIMEGGIMTFWDFLKADREKPSRMLLNMLSKHQKLKDSTDFTLLHSLKRSLNQKEFRLQDLRRRGNCVRKRSDLRKGEEMEISLGLIDVLLVSRVLKMPRIAKDHLRWCEEKLNNLCVSEGKLHRECFPVLFPS